jgi:hypothetical protein
MHPTEGDAADAWVGVAQTCSVRVLGRVAPVLGEEEAAYQG